MKKLIFFLCVIALAACGGGDKTSIEGKWQLDSVSGEELTESEKSMVMEFKSDGTCEMSRGEGETRKGSWKLSDDGKKLSITRGEGEDSKTEEWTDVELTEETVPFMEGDDKITLKRLK